MAHLSKEALGRFACRAAGFTPSQGVNLTRVFTQAGILTSDGIGPHEGAAGLLGICSRNIAQAADAVFKFLPMKVKVAAGAPDAQPHLQFDSETTLGEILAVWLLTAPEDIIAGNFHLTVMTNPAEAEVSIGLGQGRRVYTFGGTTTDRHSPSSIRSARIVPAHVIAELASLLQKGEPAALRNAKGTATAQDTRVLA